jgi:polysaccharide pyruvyl transferase WcaK-like protein
MKNGIRIALLHAYSRRNSGDGLLVDLSVALLRDAFGGDPHITVVAADPLSFVDEHAVVGAPVLAQSGAERLAGAAMALAPWFPAGARQRSLRVLLAQADLIVGVGGGYLRARNRLEALKLQAGHLLQLRAVRASRRPAVYLPQSIGPVAATIPLLGQSVAGRLKALLASLEAVFVRDDRSLDFLSGNANTRRAADLAVLELAHRQRADAPCYEAVDAPPGHVALVLREAPSWSAAQKARYQASVTELIALLEPRCRVSFAVQSTGRGNDDAAYYRKLGIFAAQPLHELVRNDPPDAVVSVRLHGALESILAGIPAFHLSYERKGFGAYEDIGVPQWVANAADFDAHAVAERLFVPGARRAFWQAATGTFERLAQERETLIETLRRAAAPKAAQG